MPGTTRVPANSRVLPTVDLGTRYGRSKGEAARAAATLRAGEARTNAESTARAYSRKRRATAPARQGHAAEMRRKRQNPNPTGSYTPSGSQFEKVEY